MDALQVLTMTPMELVNKNLYIYCDGNPVIRIDERGSLWWVAPLVGAGIGVAAQYVEDVIRNVHEGKTGSDIFTDVSDIRKYIGSAVGGAIAAIPGANVGDVIIVGYDPELDETVSLNSYQLSSWLFTPGDLE
jgi:hypothetical protein